MNIQDLPEEMIVSILEYLDENLDTDTIDQCLSGAEVSVKQKIQTHLVFENEVIPYSEETKSLFMYTLSVKNRGG